MVALRKESVDRNIQDYNIGVRARVALRKESVDRNHMLSKNPPAALKSLSARRAWIEIPSQYRNTKTRLLVALRKESVDRNSDVHPAERVTGSLSARRAWIEIAVEIRTQTAIIRRSPQGERG